MNLPQGQLINPILHIKEWSWHAKLLLKKKFGQLTLSDLKFEQHREAELLQRIGSRLDKTRHEVINILKDLGVIK